MSTACEGSRHPHTIALLLKAIRQLIRMNADAPHGLVTSLVAVAADFGDALHLAALEVICELAVRNPRAVAQADVFQVRPKALPFEERL